MSITTQAMKDRMALDLAINHSRDVIARESAIMNELRVKRARLACPHKIGDVVEVPDQMLSPYIGEQMQITDINATHPKWDERVDFIWVVHGVVLDKNGKHTKRISYFSMSAEREKHLNKKAATP